MPSVEQLLKPEADKGVKINASIVAQPFRDEIKAKVESLKEKGIGT